MEPDQNAPRFKAHLQLLREASHGLGKDIEIEFKDVERDIARLPKTVGRDYDDLRVDIELKLARLSIRAHKFRKEFPKEVKTDLRKAGRAVEVGAKAPVVYAARGARVAKKEAKKGLAKAAGAYHDPLKEWNYSGSKSSS